MPIITINITPDGRVNRADAARYLGISVKTLANWKGRGIGPACLKVGGRRFYRVADLEAFVAKGANAAVNRVSRALAG